MTTYDRKQRERINRAWNYTLDLASRTDWSAGPMLQDALRIERKARSSLIAAKSLLLDCLAANPASQTVAGLYAVSRGCQLAYILAAYWNGKPEWEKIRGTIAEAASAHREALRQSIDRLGE